MTDAKTLAGHIATLAWVAFRSFAGTLFVLILAGFALAGGSYYFLSDTPLYAGIAAAVAMAESTAAGFFLGIKRAIVMALAHGLTRLNLGKSAVQLVFGRVLGVSAEEKFGERGGAIAQTIERVPLAQAEKRLTEAIGGLAVEGGGVTGWFRRGLQRRLLGSVEKYSLACFREEGAEGGVDLVKAQTELESRMDNLLLGKLRAGLNLWTALVVLGLPFTVAVQTYLVILILHSKG